MAEDNNEGIAELLRQYKEYREMEKRKLFVQVGKELVLLLMWMKYKGATTQKDVPSLLKIVLKECPESYGEVLEYYEALDRAPALASVLMKSFQVSIYEGELKVHFCWDVPELPKILEGVSLLEGKG